MNDSGFVPPSEKAEAVSVFGDVPDTLNSFDARVLPAHNYLVPDENGRIVATNNGDGSSTDNSIYGTSNYVSDEGYVENSSYVRNNDIEMEEYPQDSAYATSQSIQLQTLTPVLRPQAMPPQQPPFTSMNAGGVYMSPEKSHKMYYCPYEHYSSHEQQPKQIPSVNIQQTPAIASTSLNPPGQQQRGFGIGEGNDGESHIGSMLNTLEGPPNKNLEQDAENRRQLRAIKGVVSMRRPNAKDNISTVTEYLMQFSVLEDEHFAKKSVESLIRKLKERNQLSDFIVCISTFGAELNDCYCIVRTQDGRLQIAGRKGFPHYFFARLFRYPDLQKNELKHHEICRYPFERMRLELVCVNPYHYYRESRIGGDGEPSEGQDDTDEIDISQDLASISDHSVSVQNSSTHPAQREYLQNPAAFNSSFHEQDLSPAFLPQLPNAPVAPQYVVNNEQQHIQQLRMQIADFENEYNSSMASMEGLHMGLAESDQLVSLLRDNRLEENDSKTDDCSTSVTSGEHATNIAGPSISDSVQNVGDENLTSTDQTDLAVSSQSSSQLRTEYRASKSTEQASQSGFERQQSYTQRPIAQHYRLDPLPSGYNPQRFDVRFVRPPPFRPPRLDILPSYEVPIKQPEFTHIPAHFTPNDLVVNGEIANMERSSYDILRPATSTPALPQLNPQNVSRMPDNSATFTPERNEILNDDISLGVELAKQKKDGTDSNSTVVPPPTVAQPSSADEFPAAPSAGRYTGPLTVPRGVDPEKALIDKNGVIVNPAGITINTTPVDAFKAHCEMVASVGVPDYVMGVDEYMRQEPREKHSDQILPSFWCTIDYYECDQKVGESFQALDNCQTVRIDGGLYLNADNRFCLGSSSNISRDFASERVLRCFQQGVLLHIKNEADIWLTVCSNMTVFAQSMHLDVQASRCIGDDPHRFEHGSTVKVFDMKQIKEEINHRHEYRKFWNHIAKGEARLETVTNEMDRIKLMAMKDNGIDDLRRLCTIRVSFGKGYGLGYRRECIEKCPCWVEIRITRALQILDEVLTRE